jgi:hypothetical protein
MSWVAVGLGTAGLLQGMANQKKMERHDAYRAEALRYSPWTGMGDPGEKNLPDAFQSGLQGAAMGASLGNLFGKTGTTVTPPQDTSALSKGTPGALGAASGANAGVYGNNMQYANMLGGVDAARNLGAIQPNQYSPYTMLAMMPQE